MLMHHAIILLLSWPCLRALETERPPSPPAEDIFDQIATASENLGLNFGIADTSTRSTTRATSTSASRPTTIHYENSNGFIPITSMAANLPSVSTASHEKNSTVGAEVTSLSGPANAATSILLEDDPAYSTEARMFLNLAGPGPDRRSFDARDGQNEFEILKVTKETPAIANYHEFYENMQNKLHRGRAGTEARYEQPQDSAGGRTNAQNQRTKQRIKSIDKYLTRFGGDSELRTSDSHNRYYALANGNAKPTSGGQNNPIFEPEKVQNNFNRNSPNPYYDIYGESASSRPRTSSLMRSNYESSVSGAKQKSHSSTTPKNRHVNSKPVVVVEPSDYKLDVKYGTERAVAKTPSIERYRTQKLRNEPEIQPENHYEVESRANPEDRYGVSYDRNEDTRDYSEETTDYLEVTEKPKKVHKSRRRPHSSDTSRRLPKEHRGHRSNNNDDTDDSKKHNAPTRAKLHRPKTKPSYWKDEDDDGDDNNNGKPTSEDSSEEQQPAGSSPSTKSEDQHSRKKGSRAKGSSTWSQIGPNLEVSHSNGFEIEQMNKPKLLVPVNLNLVPLTGFDHSTALGAGQTFDFTNSPNFVTATPMVSSPTPLLSTSQSIVTPHIAHPPNTIKANIMNNNYGMSTAIPDIIVGQNTYRNPVQALLLPQMNVHNKFGSNNRPHYLPSTVAPMFTVDPAGNHNVHGTVPPRTASTHTVHHSTQAPSSQTVQPQLVLPQPTAQSYPLPNLYNGHANYNVFVNPNGLHGQNVIPHGHPNGQGGSIHFQTTSTTPQSYPNTNANYHTAESQSKKNSDGHFLASASLSVGNGQHSQKSDNKYLPTTQHQQNSNHNNNNNYYNAHQNNQASVNNNNFYSNHHNNQQTVRAQQQQPQQQQQQVFYQPHREEQNLNAKQFLQTAHLAPTVVQPTIPLHFNSQNYANFGGHLQEQQSVVSPTVVGHNSRDQNQQILKAANDIFENTWKQLQQLQTHQDSKKIIPYQNIYGLNDNLGSTSNLNSNTANLLPGFNGNQVKAHLPILGTQHVEIVNPNLKPSPVDLALFNPYATLGHYPAAVLTTPIPIFSTTASFLTPRPAITNTDSINLQNYVNSLTQIGAHSNRVNKFEPRPDGVNQDNQRPLYNPINFIPNLDLMKSQSMLNSKVAEPLPHHLSLVPLIPGGNFFKNTYGAQNELIHKPRLSSDLEKYAEQMFKESLKTIYSTHKWNNDKKTRGNYTASELNELAKLKSELQRFRASLPDPSYSGTDLLEGHHSETKIRTAEPSKTTKKPDLSIAALEQLFKAAKHNLASSSDSSRHKNRQNNGPTSSRPNDNDFRNKHRLNDYLTPPKPNSFISKSPFNDAPTSGKKRPGSGKSRYNANGSSRTRQNPRIAAGPEASASNHLESGLHSGGPRYDKYHRHSQYSRDKDSQRHADVPEYRTTLGFDNYPTFTTTSLPDDDPFKLLSSEQRSEYDINHPRTHNLLGLLMKNKQLPTGTAQTFFRDEEELKQYFDNEKRRMHVQYHDENTKDLQKRSDSKPVDMEPPAPPKSPQIRYYTGRQTE